MTLENSKVTLHLEECDNGSAQAGLLNGKFDVILLVSEGMRPAVEFEILFQAPAYCLQPKSHRLAKKRAVCMADIAGEPMIILDRPFATAYYRGFFDTQSQAPAIAAYANSTEMVRSLVGAGHGCAILNMLPRTSISYAGDMLIALPIEGDLRVLTLSVA